MFLKWSTYKIRNIFTVAIGLSIILLWAVQCIDVLTQTAEAKDTEIKLSEMGITIKSEDVEKARIEAEEIKNSVDKSINDIQSFISNLEREVKAADGYFDKLKQEKEGYQGKEVNLKFLELLEKELDVVKGKFDIDNEQIETYQDRIAVLQDQSRAYAETVVLLKSIVRSEETPITSYDQAPMVRKEANIAKNYIAAVEAGIKEKESVVSFFTKRLQEIKDRASEAEQNLARDLEVLKEGVKDDELYRTVQGKIDNILRWKKAANIQWITIFETRLETANIRYNKALQELRNAEFNAAFIAEKANQLEERLRAEELRKKRADFEAAKKAEELQERTAEINRAEAEKALQEATRKVEEITQRQRTTTSPEKLRVLELEAVVHKQVGAVARKKDELITEGTQRYKDFTEYKELEANIGLFLSKGGSSKEIDEMLETVDSEVERFTESKTAVESLIASLQEEEKLFSDNLDSAKKEISKIENEVVAFRDKELALQAKEYMHQKMEAQKEELGLISTRLERLYERLEIKKNAIDLLQQSKEKLDKLKAANVWRRTESNISIQTLKAVYTDLAGCYGRLNLLYTVVGVTIKNSLFHKKYTVLIWARWCGFVAIFALYYFSRRYIYRWCAYKMHVLCEDKTSPSYYKSMLLPSLLTVLQNSFSILWIAVLSLSIPAILSIKTPLTTAILYVLTFTAVHKVLKGFLVESFGPEKGDKKLVTSLAYVSPKHLYKSLSIILLFSLVSLSIIAVLKAFEYRRDAIELLWFIYRFGMVILLLWLSTQRSFIMRLLPDAESQLGRFIHGVINIIYPIFVVFVVSLFAIRGLGYSVLTYLLLRTCIKSFVIAFIAFGIWRFLLYRLNYIREIRLKSDNIKKDTPEGKRFHAVTTTYNVSFKYVISIITAVIIILIWKKTFYDAAGSPAAPYPVQKIFGYIGAIMRAVRDGLLYRFTFEEGRYTTPLKIIIALVVLFASFFVARYIRTLLEDRVYHKLRLERGVRATLSTITRYVIIGIAVLIGLNFAGIPLKSLTIFAGAFGIAIGFGMQNIIGNFVSGIILLLERPIRVGDVVTFEDGTMGTIERFKVRSTTIITPDGITITVPNSKFIDSRITNLTNPTPRVRGCIKVRVSYGSNTILVKNCLLEIAKQNKNVKTHPEPLVRFAEFSPGALVFELYFWAENPEKRWFVISELNFAIDEIFRKNNIVPHP